MPLPAPLTSEKDVTGRAVTSALLSSSERDSPSQRMSLAMRPASETDSPSHSVPLPTPSPSEAELPNPGASSMSSTADRDLPSQGVYLPPTSERDLCNGEMPLAPPPAAERDLSSQGGSVASTQISEIMYMPQASRWNETTQQTSQRSESFSPILERSHTPTSQTKNNTTLASQRTEINMALTSERVYMSSSHDNMGSMSLGDDSMATTSRVDSSANPPSKRAYMLGTSPLSDSMNRTFQRSNTMFTTCERLYTPTISHRGDSSSQRTDVSLHSASERIYMSAATSQRNDNLGPAASQQADPMPSTSERMYMPHMVHTNATMTPTSEKLYSRGTSPRLYHQNTIISMEEFPSQGASLALPTLQRI